MLVNVLLCVSRLSLSQTVGLVRDSNSIREAHAKVNAHLRTTKPARVWQEFFDFQKQRINEAASKVKGRDRAIVYGAGNCHDFDLDFLADYFRRVVLVDIEEDAVSIARQKLPEQLRRKVEIELKDASCCLDSLVVPARHFISRTYGPEKSFTNLVAAIVNSPDVEITPEEEKFDFVLSTDLSSTISRVPLIYLYHRFCEEFPSLGVDFNLFQIHFLDYMQASFRFHLMSIAGHFDERSIGVVTANSVESQIVRTDDFALAHYAIDPSNGQSYVLFDSTLGPKFDDFSEPFLCLDSVQMSSAFTGFGATSTTDVFVVDSDPVKHGGKLYYPTGTQCEILEIGRFSPGTVVAYQPEKFAITKD